LYVITANGVDLINIANPNSVGVSINHYNKFNVGTQGAILNNSKVMGTSQLGGAVYGHYLRHLIQKRLGG
jgi:hypothetical protein